MAYLARPSGAQEPTDMHQTDGPDGTPLFVAFDDYVWPWEAAGVPAHVWMGEGGGAWSPATGGWS